MASHVSTLDSRKRVRRTFGQLEEVTPMPNLIDVQRFSYDTFLQMDVATHDRDDLGRKKHSNRSFPLKTLPDALFWNLFPTILKLQNMTLRNASNEDSPMRRPYA